VIQTLSLELHSEVKQLMPAPGWRVFGCTDGTDESIYELPVIGWGIVHQVSDGDGGIYDSYDGVELVIFDDECNCAQIYSDATDPSIVRALITLAPGQELTDERKAELRENFQRRHGGRDAVAA
jgi:hypothetical protein